MKARSLWAALLAVALALGGCIDSTVKVAVATDGSGTVEKTIILGKQLVDFMLSMGTKSDAATIQQGMLNEAGLRAAASQMGQGVSFVSAEKVSTKTGDGYKALYSFKDVNKLRLSQNPASDVTMPSAGGSSEQSMASASELYTFAFTKGNPSTLTVTAPPQAKPSTSTQSSEGQAGAAEAEQMMQMLRPLYADLRFAISVEVKGTIVSTNASYVSGSTVTMMAMDFGAILTDDALFKKLAESQAQSVTQAQEMLKAIPGVKIETQPSVTITFR